MHPRDNLLRAMIDQELAESQVTLLRQHLDSCPACQAKLLEMQDRASRVQGQLDTLTFGKNAQQPTPQAAFSRFTHRTHQTNSRKEFYPQMANRKPLWTVLAVFLILALVFTMTPARAWASSFLGLFRVQNITVLEFDPNAVNDGAEAFSANEESINRILEENMIISESADPYEVATLDEAAAAAGFTPGIPTDLQDGQLTVQPAMNAEFIIDQAEMQALLDALEIDMQLGPEMDGQSVTLNAPASIIITDACQPVDDDPGTFSDCTILYQMPSPTVNAPEGLNVDKLGEAMLQLLGYSPLEARAFSQTIDWTSTLIIPIPSGEGIRHQEVRVSDVTGTLFTHAEEGGYMLMWVKNGFLFNLRGPGTPEEALAIANSIP